MNIAFRTHYSRRSLAVMFALVVTTCALPTPPPPTATAPATPTPFVATQTGTGTIATPPYNVSTSQQLSPNGHWLAVTVRVSPTGNDPSPGQVTQFKLMQVDGALEWSLMDRWMPYRSGFEGWHPFYWTEDGKHLYYADWWAPDGCAIFLDSADWRRIELATGQVDEIAMDASSLVFSPDRISVAYVSGSEIPSAIGILDLLSRTERRLALGEDELRSGSIVWSPDGSALIFLVIKNACRPNEERHSIERIDVDSLTRTTLVPDDSRRLFISGWSEANRIEVYEADGGSWWLDARTGALTPKTSP